MLYPLAPWKSAPDKFDLLNLLLVRVALVKSPPGKVGPRELDVLNTAFPKANIGKGQPKKMEKSTTHSWK